MSLLTQLLHFKVSPLVAVVVICLAIYLGIRKFEKINLYFPAKEIVATPAGAGLEYEQIDLSTVDGKKLSGWFIPSGKSSAPVILFCHGNGGNYSNRVDKYRIWHSLGADIITFSYRGYAGNTGSPSEKGTYIDAETFYKYLVETRKVAPERIFIYGESLGSAIAAQTALRNKAAGLVLESGFTSVVDMGKAVYPWLPVKLMVSFKYDTLSKIGKINMPILVLHSRHDEIVPFKMAEKNFAAANGDKYFLAMGGGHNDGYEASGKEYAQALGEFFAKYNSGGIK